VNKLTIVKGITRFQLSIICALVGFGFAIPLMIQIRFQAALRGENRALKRQIEQSAGLRSRNEGLSNSISQPDSRLLAEDQFHELLRLRGEVTSLRKQKEDLEKLQPELAADQISNPGKLPLIASPVFIPKESWAFLGYATPDAAFQSAWWAGSTGDSNALLASLTQDRKLELAETGMTGSQMATAMMEEMNNVKGFQILQTEVLADDEVSLTVSFDENDKVRQANPAISTVTMIVIIPPAFHLLILTGVGRRVKLKSLKSIATNSLTH
jgi:hypothetical protein